MDTDKHAYLIIAHRNDYTFQTLLNLLDDEQNDIYIHMDVKNKLYSPTETEKILHHSNIYHTPERLNVQWGGYSQIASELALLQTAVSKGNYKYYHLLSGQDLPIKSQNYIHRFFDDNCGKEFIRFQSPTFNFQKRVCYYHLFQEYIGPEHRHILLKVLNALILLGQQTLGVRRNRDTTFQKGTNWFSITDELARYVLEKRLWIQKTFKYTKCADEIFLQTIVHNSEYVNRLYHSNYDNDPHAIMRLIDWERGRPYIWQIENKLELQNSDLLFARKFDCETDKDIIDYVAGCLCK